MNFKSLKCISLRTLNQRKSSTHLITDDQRTDHRRHKRRRHMDGLRKCQHRTGQIRRHVHNGRHGARIRRRDHRDRHEPHHNHRHNVLLALAPIADQQAQQSRHNLRHGRKQFAHTGQPHPLAGHQRIGRPAKEHGRHVRTEERQSGQHTVLLDVKAQDVLHVLGTGQDERVVHPDAAERRDANRPHRQRREDAQPGHLHADALLDLLPDVRLDVLQFVAADPRMQLRRIVRQHVPHGAPRDANRAGRVEHLTPAGVRNDEAAQRIGQPDADAEPLEAGHEATALGRRNPVADDRVHGRPRQTRCEALDAAQRNHGGVVQIGGPGDAQAAEGGGELGPAEDVFGAKVLGGDAANDLGEHVAPVERAEDGGLDAFGPVEFAVVRRGGLEGARAGQGERKAFIFKFGTKI